MQRMPYNGKLWDSAEEMEPTYCRRLPEEAATGQAANVDDPELPKDVEAG